MSAADNIQSAQFKHLYHESHLSNRESIRDQGLQPNKPFTPARGPDVYPRAVYMSTPRGSEYGSSMNDSSHYGYDKWRVNTEGLNLEKDPDPMHSTSYISRTPVESHRLTLVKKGSPDWERNI